MEERTARKASTLPLEYTSELTISVNVSDLERSVTWYRDVLGFDVDYRMDDIGWCEVKSPIGGVTVGLSQTEEVRVGGTVPTFGVRDIDAARRHLEAHKVKLDETFDVQGMVKLMGFYNPDGNPWMFSETTAAFSAR